MAGIEQAETTHHSKTFIRKDNRYEFNSLSISGAIDLAFF